MNHTLYKIKTAPGPLDIGCKETDLYTTPHAAWESMGGPVAHIAKAHFAAKSNAPTSMIVGREKHVLVKVEAVTEGE